MAVFNANDVTLQTKWKLKATYVGVGRDGVHYDISMQYREMGSENIVFPTSSIPAGSTVISATLTATAATSLYMGSATAGYKFNDAASCNLDGTRISKRDFSKDITSKFANMNGGTFTDISIPATYNMKLVKLTGISESGEESEINYNRAYGNIGVGQAAQLKLTNLAITVEYSGGGGEVTPTTKWQKCEVYVCVPVS